MLNISEEKYDDMMDNEIIEITNDDNKPVTRPLITKLLNLTDNIFELKYYETLNLIWKVKYDDIPDEI